MQIISKIFLSFVLLLISACTSLSAEHIVTPQEEPSMTAVKQSWQQVTVKYLDFEGGFYGLVSEKGAKLLPISLPAKYKIEGTILRVKGHILTDMMTIQQWGEAFKIVEIKLIKMGVGNRSIY